jgi:hypothetical protein
VALGSLVVKGLKAAAEKRAKAAAERVARLAVPVPHVRPVEPLRVPVRPSLAVKALPAPRKRLALPAPGPKLPPEASKPRGGQFWADKPYGGTPEEMGFRVHDRGEHADPRNRYQVQEPEGRMAGTFETPEWAEKRMMDRANERRPNYSPEEAARQTVAAEGLLRGGPDTIGGWLSKALPKYYKTDFGGPTDPLRDLAGRGLHYDPEMTPDRWGDVVNSTLMEDRIGDYTLPTPRSNYGPDIDEGGMQWYQDELARRGVIAQMPWLEKAPVTDKLYGIGSSGLDLGHFTDEMQNAVQGRLPPDLAIRPESLTRMTFPQAVEHVGKINQFRVKEMERAGLTNLESPAVHPFKEYPENNPKGLRWVQLKQPDVDTAGFRVEQIPEGSYNAGKYIAFDPEGQRWPQEGFNVFENEDDVLRNIRRRRGTDDLADALKYEGDTMGHCVGGYCKDVASGRSNIYSLRDAKGEPHVTIETEPYSHDGPPDELRQQWEEETWDDPENDAYNAKVDAWHAANPSHNDVWNEYHYGMGDINALPPFQQWKAEKYPGLRDSIVQIKGKQNLAPKDDYLPFVQDFVKSGNWAEVGDLGHTGLMRLPDGRYIGQNQFQDVVKGLPRNPAVDRAAGNWGGPGDYEYWHGADDVPVLDARRLADEGLGGMEWNALKPHFEGYAYGGRVEKGRNWARGPLAVY